MNTLLQLAKFNKTTTTLTVFTVNEITGSTTKLTTVTQPGVADGAYLQMGNTCSPN